MNMKKIKTIGLVALFSISNAAIATNVDEWVSKEIEGSLKSSPGCKSKEEAIEKVKKKPDSFKGYSRFDKYAKILCEGEGYGWTLEKVIDEGEVVCEECEADFAGKYRCYVKDVKLLCKQVVR